MISKKWVWSPVHQSDKVAWLNQVLTIPKSIASILVDRSIETFDQAKSFFRPRLEDLYDPFAMKGMAKAIERLLKAIYQTKEKILIYGDYDVDGTTAVAMVWDFLQQYCPEMIQYYIPDRHTEGYGVSQKAIEMAYQSGVSLMITLDCGIKDHRALALAAQKGIDVIVCDHHHVGQVLPPAYVILNPKQQDCSYPFQELSGCGIGFKLLQAFCQKTNTDLNTLYKYLDLVAISCACDLVPLVGENRILTVYGLKKLAKKPNIGLKALMDLQALAVVTIADLAFKIGPHINAAGRVHHAGLVVELLTAKTMEQAKDLVVYLHRYNTLRQELDQSITQQALAAISAFPNGQKSYILFNEHWHKGVIGIVAARCIEKYYRPTIVLTRSSSKVIGSARSVPGYDIYQAIAGCSELLDQYGGHAFAAGLSMPLENVSRFQKKFEQVVAQTITDELLLPKQCIHAWIPLTWITPKLVNIVLQMAPFGLGNPMPIFASYGVYAKKCMVLKGAHLKLEVGQPDCDKTYQAIGFGLAHCEPLVLDQCAFCLAYSLDYNLYWGHPSIQLIIKDIQPITHINFDPSTPF